MLTDNEARRIASEWYSGVAYQFVNTGTISADIIKEFELSLEEERHSIPIALEYRQNIKDLNALLEYLNTKGNRGPQEGWANVNF